METTFLDKKNYIRLYQEQSSIDRKQYWKSILALFVIVFLVSVGINVLFQNIFGASFLTYVFVQLVTFFLGLYSVKYILNLIDNKKVSFIDTLRQFSFKQFLYALGANILMLLGIYLGFLLLIIPGIIISYIFILTFPISADRTFTPIKALKESRRLTRDYKIKIFNVSLSLGIYYAAIPVLMVLFINMVQLFTWPMWIVPLAIAILIISVVYAQLSLATLLPRMYRDLQKIKNPSHEE